MGIRKIVHLCHYDLHMHIRQTIGAVTKKTRFRWKVIRGVRLVVGTISHDKLSAILGGNSTSIAKRTNENPEQGQVHINIYVGGWESAFV